MIVCRQSEAFNGSLSASLVNTYTLPTRKRVFPGEVPMAWKGRNGRLELGWSLCTCLPPCPKADLGTRPPPFPFSHPKRGTKSETRALLQSQSSTAPGPSYRTFSTAPPSFPLSVTLSASPPPPDTYPTTTLSTLEEQNTV